MSLLLAAAAWALAMIAQISADRGDSLDRQLQAALASHGFTGRIESALETRLGRKVNLSAIDQSADTGQFHPQVVG